MVNLNTCFLKKILTEEGVKFKVLPQGPNKADSASFPLNTTKHENCARYSFLEQYKEWKLSGELLAVFSSVNSSSHPASLLQCLWNISPI